MRHNGGSNKDLVDDDEEEEENREEDVYMYMTNMNPDERANYRVACRASKASE